MPRHVSHVPPPGSLVLDHVSHFVPDLGRAARALESLGFAVAPESAQATQDGPAGTSNVCVMLEAGYLEFLAPTAQTPNAERLRAAMQRYPGVHLACFGTPAAEEEHARLDAHGFAPSPVVELRRETEAGLAQFKVVRPAPDRMPEGRVQFVQHLTPDVVWDERWMRHGNGVTALACVFVVAEDVAATAARWAEFGALLPRPAGRFAHLQTERGDALIGRPADWHAVLGHAVPAPPALAGYALECANPAALAALAERAGATARKLRPDLHAALLPPELGGAWVFGTRSSLALDR